MSSDSWIPEGLKLSVTQGRQPRKMVMACTQRLSECHPVFRSQSEHIIIFVPAPIQLDLKTIAGHIGREPGPLGQMLLELEEEYGLFSHLWYVRPGNELRRCAPLPPPSRPPARPQGATGPPATHDDPEAQGSGDEQLAHAEEEP